MKISAEVQKMVNALPADKLKKVEAIVKRHVEACRRVGVEPESPDRAWIEAIEAVNIDENFADTMDEKWPEWEPIRRYDVYSTPSDTRM